MLIDQRGEKKASNTQVKTRRSLPALGDGDFDVDAFLEDFEEMVGLANGGQGMSAT